MTTQAQARTEAGAPPAGGGKVGELVVITSQLVDLIEREIALLRAGKVRAIQPLQDEKARLVLEYEAKQEVLRTDPALFAAVAPALRAELVQATQRLNLALARNATAIEAARDVTNRVLDAVVHAATAEHVRNRGYRAEGRSVAMARPARGEAVSLMLDRRM